MGLDLSTTAFAQSEEHQVTPVAAHVLALPLSDGVADVVSAGEILEHVADHSRATLGLDPNRSADVPPW